MFNIGSIIDQIKQKNSTYTEVKIEGGGRHKITNEQMEQLTRVLSENSHVTELWIHALNLNRTQVETLASFLKSNKTLKKFTAISHTIHDYGTKIICEALQHNNIIEHVDLSCNDATYSGGYVKAVADMLLKNRTINSLGFGWDNITPKGVSLIIDTLVKRNIPMKELALGYSVRNEGARKVANYIKTQSSLTKLHLATNGMTGHALKELIDVIKTHSTLLSLSFTTNLSAQFATNDIDYFLTQLDYNRIILDVRFDKSANLTGPQQKELERILERNRLNTTNSVWDYASSTYGYASATYEYVAPVAQAVGGYISSGISYGYNAFFGGKVEETQQVGESKSFPKKKREHNPSLQQPLLKKEDDYSSDDESDCPRWCCCCFK